ncbi:hypothetical protein HPB51_012397 [Rhipicephalus microplus]|uniref:Uncharacterized protein n=1 Tax=Rhipicephalus microplus TaxID=6941 RepID=A0A9J6E9L9_RHIMP|nr:hypothetical protein HPB51_012397 [Rhipicephalus microplus]
MPFHHGGFGCGDTTCPSPLGNNTKTAEGSTGKCKVRIVSVGAAKFSRLMQDRKDSPVTFLGALADSWCPPKPNTGDGVSSHVVTRVPTASLLELRDKARSQTSPKFASAANVRNAGSAIDPPVPGSKQAAEPQVLSRLRAASPRCPKPPSGPPPNAGDVALRSRDIVSKSPLTSDRVSEKSHDASHDKNSQPPGGVERSTVSMHSSMKGSAGAVLKDAWPTSGQSVPYLIAAFVVLCVAVILITALTLRSTKYGKPILAWVLRENETRRFPVPLPKRRQEDARGTTAVTTEKNSFS